MCRSVKGVLPSFANYMIIVMPHTSVYKITTTSQIIEREFCFGPFWANLKTLGLSGFFISTEGIITTNAV